MSQKPETIQKNPVLKPAEDYYRLRKEGIGFIAEMGSRLWTDYNTHDPGITILEALCYAITDLAFRTAWDIKDILAPKTKAPDAKQPFPDQPFFTARDILTVNPSTSDDFRRLLIDCDLVRNAWVFCKAFTCDLNSKTVELLGLYEILLELEADPELGDLNDYKVEHNYPLFDLEGIPHPVTLELRFPKWGLENPGEWKQFLDSGASFTLTSSLKLNRNKVDEKTKITDTDLRNNWRKIFYVTFEITLSNTETFIIETINIENVALRIIGDVTAKNNATLEAFNALLNDITPTGIIQRYRNKLKKIAGAVSDAKCKLHSHRNLDEDYSRVKIVNVEDIAVCADVEVAAGADIEWVQAKIWFEIEQYFNPPVPIYTLQELIKDNVHVEDIFNGPKLDNGFIKAEELEKAGLKKELRTSDIINRLMDIKGVVSVTNLLLSKYDSEGNLVKGAADPGTPDPNRTSASWLLLVSELHQPRLYHKLSRFLFKKNGLPFLPHDDEAYATLIQLRGETERPKIKNADKDLPVPEGTFRNPDDYYPVQYSFPLTYCIGTEGLPSHVSDQRRAQARQLKAYLMLFEQILGNGFAQLAHTADLFSLDPLIERTYFVLEFCKDVIQGYDEITKDLDKAKLEQMAETEPDFHKRRNRFLNHIMARFGEQFNEYALLLTNLEGEQVALDRLIEEKISFLKVYPLISSDRGKAFDYKNNPCSPDNQPGLQRRLKRLLGFACSKFAWTISVAINGAYTVTFDLWNNDGKVLMNGSINVTVGNESEAKQLAFEKITARMKLTGAYTVKKIGDKQFQTILTDEGDVEIARTVEYFESEEAAKAFIGKLILPQKAINLEYTVKFDLLDEDGNILINGSVKVPASYESEAKQSAFKKISDRMKQRDDAYNVEKGGANQFETILTDEGGVAIIARTEKNFPSIATARSFIGDLILGTPHSWSDNERFIIVEHLLLRPKFPGDAVYPVSADGSCESCETDPYSFRLTFVMPGWAAPFDTNMEMRHFADRTIQQETPAHLLPKICWVGNDGFILNPLDPVLVKLAKILKASGAAVYQLDEAANICAAKIHEYFWEKFHKSFIERKTGNWLKCEWPALRKEFEDMEPSDIAFVSVERVVWEEIKATMLDYFTQIAFSGWQFERFEEAWNNWLKANSKIDWTEVYLQERVEALLKAGLDPSATAPTKNDLRQCAGKIISDYGTDFYEWMKKNIGDGKSWQDFGDIPILEFPDCNGISISDTTKQEIKKLLVGDKDNNQQGLYNGWVEVSYRMWILLDLLSKLRNIYPGATLHDCDEGNDQNPVRLGSTALGNYPLQQASPLSAQSANPLSDPSAEI
ncbi:MAG: hypothetical protein PHO08_14750 [Methylococcales bacterium]|nr:hypothetical protein [Methylococcales bacterium]MDD5630870.1 hypothetical protein [Methylococcales bacterium]